MIAFEHISKVFNAGQPNAVTALQNIQLTIQAGDFLVLIGSNGSGKTTLLNLVAGAYPPSAGRIFFKNEDVTALPEYRRSRWVARVFQDPLGGTAPELSVLDNFRLAALRTRSKSLRIGSTSAFRKQVQEKIATLGMGLENQVQQPMGTLSGGQRQALTLLMSAMDHTDILLLDEPTAALDPKSAEVVLETAQKIIRERQLTAVLITHDLQEALRYGNRLIQLHRGAVLRDLDAEAKAGLDLPILQSWFQ